MRIQALTTREMILAALLLLFAVFPLYGIEPDAGRGGSRWGANYFPNVELITHEGKTVRFFDDLIQDRVVVINFIYTTCPDACPLETSRLAEVQGILGDRVGRDIFMYSITIDPEHDTVSVMKEYSERYQAGPGWLFLTGDKADILSLRKKLGLFIPDKGSDNPNDHNLNLMIGNQATGQWMRRSPFENPYVLATQIGTWLHNFAPDRSEDRDYGDAPKLRNLERGEMLFRTRCAVCHIIGEGDGRSRVGPDLMGVTGRRDPEWLSRWIIAPDRMIADGDPIALGLYLAYNKVPMPNMRLSSVEVEELLDFIETETHRVEKMQKIAAVAPPPSVGAAELESCCQKDENVVLSAREPDGSDLAEPDSSRGRLAPASLILAGILGALGLALRVRG